MNSVKLQDTKSTYKNQWHFYTLTTDYQKIKKIIPIIILIEKIK